MNIDTSAIKQLKAFNDFVKDFGFNSTAVAKINVSQQERGVTMIARNVNDKANMFLSFFRRSQDNKSSNNNVRDLFKNAIIQLFGGKESDIPQDVKKVMELKNFNGNGRPLTAKRINLIHSAVVKSLSSFETITDKKTGNTISADAVKSLLEGEIATPTNTKILKDIQNYDTDNLPQDIKDALEAMKNTINNRCGQGTAKTLDDVLDFFGGANRFKYDLLHVANGLVRDLNGSDVNNAMAKMLKENPLFELSKLLERLEVLAKDVAGVKVSNNVANDMLQNIPGLYDALKECTTPVDYKATLDEYTPKIMARLQINAKLNEFKDKSVEILKKQFQEITGLDPEKQIPQRTLSVFKDKDVVGLLFDISKGKVTVNTAEDVEKAFVKLAKDFVEQRQKLADEFCEQLKGFQLPDWVRSHLRQSALVVANIKEFNTSGVKSAVEFDLKPLKTAISAKTFNLKDVSANMVDIMRKIYDAGIKCVGAGTWQALGIEGQFEFAKIMVKCALANDKDLIATLNAHVDEIVAEVQRYVDTLPNDDAYYADKQIRSINNGFNFAVKELASDMP